MARRSRLLIAARVDNVPPIWFRTRMKATIYHNPKCGTSRKTLEILQAESADVTVLEYLKTPPTREELQRLYAKAGISPREGLRAKEPLAQELGLAEADDEAILDAMMQHPILITARSS